ncbi:MAG: glucans biosynthesis glucosyltransferase MdoH [Planctomycetes bacterium]|nr:glucans biosynthesis glucosyltransferase MdoH [Planctomycetota bacterium]
MDEPWQKAAWRRRCLLILLTVIPSLLASWVMYGILPAKQTPLLNAIIALLFAALFTWVSMGFWSAVAGLLVLLFRHDRFVVTAGLPDGAPLAPEARAAILFPLFNEDVTRVIEGVRVVWRSLAATGHQGNFDIYILSDSTSPDAWVNEEEAWHALCRDENAADHIFYRHRKINRKGKSGNVADFCRRWGANYPYMIVFDADSIISGKTLVKMVQAMESRPDIGILQTTPKAINSQSLIARVQQFANHLYGPAFAAGLHYWQLGDAQYWGHNAIIRTEQFIRHCHLPVLPGRKPLGGPILSHDFVEAAHMRRAGYGVWLAYELDGSYEEAPPSLIDELIRDRRWCQGNLQHSKLVFAQGFFPTHRALFINGIMSYLSALLWFFFLLVSSFHAVAILFSLPDYFPEGTLFPVWPEFFSGWMLALCTGTAVLLFLPKFFVLVLVLAKGGAGAFGGGLSLVASAVLELVLSALLAPVRMLYHSLFIITTLLGFTVRWNTQNRDASGTTWLQAFRFHWWGVVIGLVWGAFMYLINPDFFLWLSPIIAGLILSVPLSVWTSRVSVGAGAVRAGLFLTPADTRPATVLRALAGRLAHPETVPVKGAGFVRAVTSPSVHSLHVAMTPDKPAVVAEKEALLDDLVDKAVRTGPEGLSRTEKILLLSSPRHLSRLHSRVWRLEDAAAWGIPW